jgi:dienelactone hydrolase
MGRVGGSNAFPGGVRHFALTDPKRVDKQDGGNRRFTVTVFYPGVLDETKEAVALRDLYKPALRKGLEALARWHKVPLALDAYRRAGEFRFEARQKLKLQKSGAQYPVLICSAPGEGDRFATAPLCIRLASAGYVVFSIDHPHDAKVVAYPDRTICDTPLENESHMLMRILDVVCLLDYVKALAGKGFLSGSLDLERIGAFGHSRGGATAVASTFWTDDVRAGINFDGYLFGFDYKESCGLNFYDEPFRQKVLSQEKPILRLLGVPKTAGDLSPFSFEAESKFFGGPFIHGKLPGWSHSDFSSDRMSRLIKGEEIVESKGHVDALDLVARLFFQHMLSNPKDVTWTESVQAAHPDWEIHVKPFASPRAA